jgi:acyl-CoA synthetase (NDP forming)
LGLNGIAFTNELLVKAMDAAGITSYTTPEAAARAMATLVKYAEIMRRFANAS